MKYTFYFIDTGEGSLLQVSPSFIDIPPQESLLQLVIRKWEAIIEFFGDKEKTVYDGGGATNALCIACGSNCINVCPIYIAQGKGCMEPGTIYHDWLNDSSKENAQRFLDFLRTL